MKSLPGLFRAAFFALAFLSLASVLRAEEPIRVLILTGRVNHDWRATTPAMKAILEGTGRFKVDVTTNPSEITAAMLAPYHVILSNWNTYDGHTELEQWPAEAKQAYLDFVRGGKGHVVVHAGGCSFYSWPEYQQMIGGASWKKGTSKFIAPGPPLNIRPSFADHPVMAGLPAFTTTDELYCKIGLAAGVKPLAEGFGDGDWHPVAAVNSFGQGRNFILLLGHDVEGMKNPGFQTLLTRGTEWAGTGKVTLPVMTQAIGFPETVTAYSKKKAEQKAKIAAAAGESLAATATVSAATAAPPPAEDLESALSAVGNYRLYGDRKPLQIVSSFVAQAGADEALRARLADRLASLLSDKITPDGRAFLCEQLGLLGAADKIPAIEPRILDKETAVRALGALERIGGNEAAQAVRKALAKANEEQSIALMLSAGRMGDEAAVAEIQKRLTSPLPVASAAIQALGDIGSPAALAALVEFRPKAPKELQSVSATALLAAAVECKKAGWIEEARKVFDLLLNPSSPPQVSRLAFAESLALDGSSHEKLKEALRGRDRSMRAAALAALSRGKIAGGTSLMIEALPGLSAEEQIPAIAMLGDSGDAAAIPALEKAAADSNPAVRQQAYQALGRLGAAAVADFLLDQAASAPPEDIPALRLGLNALKNENILPALKARFPEAPPGAAKLMIEQFVRRGDISAAPLLMHRLAKSDRDLANAIVAGLGELGDAATIPGLIALIGPASPVTPDRVKVAVIRIAKRQPRETAAALLALWENSSPESRAQWVEVFGSVEDPSALALLKSLLDSKDEALRLGAIRGLGNWPDASPYDLMIETAVKTEDVKSRALALRSAAALLDRAQNYDASQFAKALDRGLGASNRPEEKRLFIALAAHKPSPPVESLLKAHADDPEIRDEVKKALEKPAATPAAKSPQKNEPSYNEQ